jgi:hypothetical protein
MIKIAAYLNYIREKGKPLNEFNEGSTEYALEVDDALHAIELLKGSQIPVLGGDILTDKSGSLIYAYQLWGSEYHSLNWFCEKEKSETKENYCNRSHNIAKEAIGFANITAKKLGQNCYVNLVV